MRSIYDHLYDDLIRIADFHTHDRMVSEDALQEVFADIFLRHKEIGTPHGESIIPYLIRAVTNHSITLYRKRARSATDDAGFFYTVMAGAHEEPIEAVLISNEKQSFLRLIVGTLPPREKECMLLRIDHAMKVKAIAVRLGITQKAVEWNLRSARRRLKRFRAQLP